MNEGVKSESRCLSLMLSATVFCTLGCSKMSAWQSQKASELGAWPEGPATVPDDPADLDSGILTPFSQLNPDKEVWVASYGDDTAAGTLFAPKRTIGAALLIAAPGTAIMVKAGIYRENLTIDGPGGSSGKPIWLRSADGKGAAEMAALLAGAEALRVVAANAIIVEGFKINGGVSIESNATKASTNIVLQNNMVTNGLGDGIYAEYVTNLWIIANDVSSSPRGQGVQIMGGGNVLIADNYIHDLRTSGAKNDGVNLKGNLRDVMIQNNIVDRIDGTALVLEGMNVTARANSLQGTRRAVTYSGCNTCTLERNNIHVSTGMMSDVALMVGDSSVYPTTAAKLINNCTYRQDWLYVEVGTGTGLVSQGNSERACQ